jgi:topoisomerase-4 subunit B
MRKEDLLKELLEFYMGKNTPERQNSSSIIWWVEDEEVA